MSGLLLETRNLSMRFGGLTAVDDLSFQVKEGSITSIIGPNGAGKTTVFNCITGFYKPTGGNIRVHDGTNHLSIESMPGYDIVRKARIARTFQNIRLFPYMTALENLLVAQHNELMRASWFSIAGLLNLPSYRKAEREALYRAMHWLNLVGLSAHADTPASGLPYGGQRRLEIARAMCLRPRLVCLDEPAAGLNPRETDELNQLLLRIRRDHGATVLLIEHDMRVVMKISDHIVVLDYGRKIAEGNAKLVQNHPDVIRAYLGEEHA